MLKQKKKKTINNKQLILSSLELMSPKERKEIQSYLTEKVKTVFRHCIGEENAVDIYDVFYKVFDQDANSLDDYLVFYWVSILNRVIRKLRYIDEMFIIKKNKTYFVLKRQSESNYYKGILDMDIANFEKAKRRADKWIREEKWKNL